MPEYVNDIDKILADQKVLSTFLSKGGRDKDPYDTSMRLFNSPFCLLDTVDPVINSKVQIGRKYMECIASNASIVYLIPGTATFMPEASDEMRKASIGAIGNDAPESILKEIFDTMGTKDGMKYFDFRPDYNEYMKYVNALCRAMAIFLGIGDKKGPNGQKYEVYNWGSFKDDYRGSNYDYKIEIRDGTMFEKEKPGDVMESLFGDWQYIKFYADTGTSSSESFGNGTTESKIAGMVSSGSDLTKELYFLGDFIDSKSISNAVDTAKKGIESIVSKITGDTGARLGNLATNMINGNSVLFPEIYSNSDYSSNYNLKFNLISPYGDTESVYLNVWVPFFHLMALVCPRQVKGSANAYSSPFIVKSFSRGWYNCNMGIVESMGVERGDEWNVNGLPTNLQVTLSIKDLYSDLMISKSTEPGTFLANQSLMDYLAVSAGVDISKPMLLKKMELITAIFKGSIVQIPDLIYEDMLQTLRNITDKLFKAVK